MEVKLGQIIDSVGALKALLQEKLPAIKAFKLSKGVKKFQEELNFYEETRLKLVEQYGEKVGETTEVRVKPENHEVFYQEIMKLRDSDIEVDLIKITLDDLKDAKLTVEEISTIEFLIED